MSDQEKKFGLLGRNISYSFSRKYFTDKFKKLQLDTYSYVNYDLPRIEDFKQAILQDMPILGGLNVTIPYKEAIIPYLDEVDDVALEIAAVNTIKILKNNKLKGYNTDIFGFEKSLRSCWRGDEQRALILGTGGASKAVRFVLNKMGIESTIVSRNPDKKGLINYSDLNERLIIENEMIINCTPLGTFPDVEVKPDIPYQFIGKRHLLCDLIYNPEKTVFLEMGESAGATIMNGKPMLEFQADRSWEIWNS